jgi:glycosyltransferase involved in cell wall biosynthesis
MVFSAGRIWDEAKDISLLRRIAPRLAWPVQIAGSPDEPGLSRGVNAVAETDVITLLGHLSPHRLAEELGATAIYAAPARYEPFGLAILEAALCGCALVLSDLPSLRASWEGAAIFVPPGDDTAWVDVLQQLIADSDKRTELALRSRERARQFTPAAMGSRFLDLYRKLARRVNVQPEAALA